MKILLITLLIGLLFIPVYLKNNINIFSDKIQMICTNDNITIIYFIYQKPIFLLHNKKEFSTYQKQLIDNVNQYNKNQNFFSYEEKISLKQKVNQIVIFFSKKMKKELFKSLKGKNSHQIKFLFGKLYLFRKKIVFIYFNKNMLNIFLNTNTLSVVFNEKIYKTIQKYNKFVFLLQKKDFIKLKKWLLRKNRAFDFKTHMWRENETFFNR